MESADRAALQAALRALQQGDAAGAAGACRRLLAFAPDDFGARHLLGVALLVEGDAAAAEREIARAIALDGGVAGAHFNHGNVLFALDRASEAVAAYEAALRLKPDFAEAWCNRGNACARAGRPGEAMASYRSALALRPAMEEARDGLAEALVGQAMARRSAGAAVEALADADAALRLRRSARALDCRGMVLNDLGRYEEARADFAQALALEPGSAETRNNLANALHDLGRDDEALDQLRAVVAAAPDFPEAWNNIGMVLQELRRFDEARAAYDRALALRPESAEAWKRRATLRLLLGDLRGGWADFGTSLERARRHAPGRFAQIPFWRGEALAGRTILLSEPSGLGDTIQFWRFVPALLAAGARVTFAGSPRMSALLGSSGWPVRFVDSPDPGERFDFQAELRMLPHLLEIDVADLPGTIPYLRADEGARGRVASLAEPGRLNIGICWQGNPGRKIDAGRSVPLAAFLPLSRHPGARLVSLQRQHGLEQLQVLPAGMDVVDPGPGFDSGPDAFVDTAALVSQLDLVVTSDTAVAHLAGALGRPVWVALRRVPEWRWMIDREDSPWYPRTRLFRQPRAGDWGSVFAAMAGALAGAPGGNAISA